MSAERRPQNPNERSSQFSLTINWYASKDTVAGFTRAAFEDEYIRDRDFRMRTRGATFNVQGLLYDLGHSGRGLQDFPRELALIVPRPRRARVAWREEPNLLSAVPFPQLYDQITQAVERYVVETYRKRGGLFPPRQDEFQSEIDALKALSEQCKRKIVRVTFAPSFGKLHMIEHMECEGISYEERF